MNLAEQAVEFKAEYILRFGRSPELFFVTRDEWDDFVRSQHSLQERPELLLRALERPETLTLQGMRLRII